MFGGSADQGDVYGYEESTFSIPKALSLFFGVVLLAGLFFGAGYQMGHTAALNQQAAAAQVPVIPATVVPPKEKPAAALEATPEDAAAAAPPFQEPVVQETDTATTAKQSVDPPKGKAEPKAAVAQSGAFTVQVAAVRHQEDAEALVGALRKKEYPVFLASAGSDALFHVQVGPFINQKEAEAMRARLSGDGYNAILKK
jgi:cell division septation protein DedD